MSTSLFNPADVAPGELAPLNGQIVTPAHRPACPTRFDDFILRMAAEEIVKDLQCHYPQFETEALIDVLHTILKGSHSFDGFLLGKGLDDEGLTVNATIISDLDTADHHVDKAHNAAIRQWIQAYNVTPRLAKGDHVLYRGESGIILEVDQPHRPGAYWVALPSRGDTNTSTGRSGAIIMWDVLEAENADLGLDSVAHVSEA